MGDNELMVTIPLERYNELITTETRSKVLTDTTLASDYGPDKKVIATILGFELPDKENKEGGLF